MLKYLIFLWCVSISFLSESAASKDRGSIRTKWVHQAERLMKSPGNTAFIKGEILMVSDKAGPVALLKLGGSYKDILVSKIMRELGLSDTIPKSFLVKKISVDPSISSRPLSGLMERAVIFMPRSLHTDKLGSPFRKILEEVGLWKKSGSITLDSFSKKISLESFEFFQNNLDKKSVHEAFLYYFLINAHDLYKRNILIYSDGKKFFIKCIDHEDGLEVRKDRAQRIGIIGSKTDIFGLAPADLPLTPSLRSIILKWDISLIGKKLSSFFLKAGVSKEKMHSFLDRIRALRSVVSFSRGRILPRNLDTLSSLLVRTGSPNSGLLIDDKISDNNHTSWMIKGSRYVSTDVSRLPLIENCLIPSEIGGGKYSGWMLLKMIAKHRGKEVDAPDTKTQILQWLWIIGGYIDTKSPLYPALLKQIPQLLPYVKK
ncbi:hypothetical protein OAN21_01690 [Alphaproteobacteria bacterium]|nr:hypothetical protein [Alphaproteobacteria bacterium]